MTPALSTGIFCLLLGALPAPSVSFVPTSNPVTRGKPLYIFDAIRDLQKKIDEEAWDFLYGRKERIWSPDRRPEEMRGVRAGPGPDSQLSWGGAETFELYEAMVTAQEDDMVKAAARTKDEPLGSAAVALVGESAKDDTTAEMAAMKDIMVPMGLSRNIADAVELAELVFAKYGRYHDCTILRNSGQIAFNIYGPCLGLRSFPYTEEQYLEKLGTTIAMLNDFDQAWYVKQFLLSPIVPRNGLPSTPRYDTAVTLRLNLSPTWKNVDQTIVEEWFAAREVL